MEPCGLWSRNYRFDVFVGAKCYRVYTIAFDGADNLLQRRSDSAALEQEDYSLFHHNAVVILSNDAPTIRYDLNPFDAAIL